jgi:hypothetical protein
VSLLDDIREYYEDASYPPDGSEVDAELVSEEDNDQARWGTWFTNVYKREDEYVAVTDVRPATEMQDWGDYGKPEIKLVTPVVKTVQTITYVPLDSADSD